MDCSVTENLLALYYEGKLSVEAAMELENHIASCDACLELADAWISLEPRLTELKKEVPFPLSVASRVINNLGLNKKNIFSFFRFSRPAFAASGLVFLALFSFIFRNSVERMLPGISESYSIFYDSTLNSISAWLSKLLAGPAMAYIAFIDGIVSTVEKMYGWHEAIDFRILFAVYILILVSMSVSFGHIVRRILRD